MANRYKLIHTGNRGSEINSLTEKTTPVDADMVGLMDSAASNVLKKLSWANIKSTLKTYFDTLYGTSGTGAGWISLGTATYEGADSPSFTFSLASDMTGILSAGMRIKLTQTTVKYFIITAVGAYSGGKTIITVYGGTDYTLANATITSPYYSIQKAPFGFPLDPTKWTVETTDNGNRSQGSPVAGTKYNVTELNTSVPIGAWVASYIVNVDVAIAAGVADQMVTLSTANNSESDTSMTSYTLATIRGGGVANKSKFLVLSSKTTYYLNIFCSQANSSIGIRGDNGLSILRFVCAYL